MSGPGLADVELNRKAQPALDRTSTRQRTEDAPKAIWVTWERHRRTHELCRSLGVELFELTSSSSAIIRYPYLMFETFLCLARQRPALLFIQCPSVLLGLWAGFLKYVFGYQLIADLHNEAIEPFNCSAPWYRALVGQIRRMADLSLVSNDFLKAVVDGTGGRAFVLPDTIPAISSARDGAAVTAARPQVVFVCTYAPDEPYLEVIEAVRLMGPSLTLHVTGDHRRLKPAAPLPSHVHLTGYVSEPEYQQLLREADVIVDLTRMENCLVCGAYEAVALEKPLVTSDTRALRNHFRLGTVYSGHDPQSLAESIAYALTHKDALAAEMKTLKRELIDQWAHQREALRDILNLEVP